MNETSSRLTIKVALWMQILLIACTLFLAAGAANVLISVFQESLGNLFLFIVLGSFAYMCGANAVSTIEITNESVTVNVFYGRFRIHWSEVQKMMVNSPLIALVGNDKRVVVSLAFAGSNSAKMLEIFDEQVRSRSIVLEKGTPFPITHQNARVWR